MVANLFGAEIPLHGYTLWHQRFVFLSSALFACGAALLGASARAAAARRRVGARATRAVAVLLGTSLTYYATYMPSYAPRDGRVRVRRRSSRYWAITRRAQRPPALARARRAARRRDADPRAGAGDGHRRRARGRRSRPCAPRRAVASCARWWLGGGALALGVALVVFMPQLLEWHARVRQRDRAAAGREVHAARGADDRRAAVRAAQRLVLDDADRVRGGDRPVRAAAARAPGRVRACSPRSRSRSTSTARSSTGGAARRSASAGCATSRLPLVVGLASAAVALRPARASPADRRAARDRGGDPRRRWSRGT